MAEEVAIGEGELSAKADGILAVLSSVSFHQDTSRHKTLGHIKVIILEVTGRVCDLLQANVCLDPQPSQGLLCCLCDVLDGFSAVHSLMIPGSLRAL